MSIEIEIKRGSTFSQTCLCVDELDQPIDLSLWSFASDLKLAASNETLISFNIDDTAASAGQVRVYAPASDTLNLPPEMTLVFDIKFTDGGGDIHYSDDIVLTTSKHITN
jgi:hypothetical protein